MLTREQQARLAEIRRRLPPVSSLPGAPGVQQPSGRRSDPSGRELEVLTLVADGLTNAEIAAELVISIDTVKTHVRHLIDKLGATGRPHLVANGFRRGHLI